MKGGNPRVARNSFRQQQDPAKKAQAAKAKATAAAAQAAADAAIIGEAVKAALAALMAEQSRTQEI